MAYQKLTPIVATGATEPRYIGDRFAEAVNVKDFGAAGDGTTDDTTAIQAALTACVAKMGGVVFVPDGVYIVKHRLSIGSNVCIYNASNVKYLVQHTEGFILNDNEAVFASGEDETATSNISFINGTIEQDLSYYAGCNMITVQKCTGVEIKNVSFVNTVRSHAIEIGICKNVEISGCRFIGYCYQNDSTDDLGDRSNCEIVQIDPGDWDSHYGISENIYIHDCYFGPNPNATDARVVGVRAGIGSHNVNSASEKHKHIRICNNIFDQCSYTGVRCYNWNGVDIAGNLFKSCFRAVTISIVMRSTVPVTSTNVNIDSNTIDGCTGEAIYSGGFSSTEYESVTDASVVEITNNKIFQTSTGNAVTLYFTNHVNFASNHISLSSGTGVQFIFCDHVNVANNFFESGTSESGYGVRVLQSDTYSSLSTITKYNISNNWFSGFAQGVSGADTQDKWGFCVDNNTFQSFGTHAVRVFNIRGGSISGNNAISYTAPTYVYQFGGTDISVKNNGATSSYIDDRSEALQYTAASGQYGLAMSNAGVCICSTETSSKIPGIAFHGFSTSQVGIARVGSGTIPFGKFDWSSRSSTAEVLYGDKCFYPATTNTGTLGTSSNKWNNIYSTSGPWSGSDERNKRNIVDVQDALMRAWGNVNFKVFQFVEAIEKKGENARLHVGVIAQQVAAAFEAEGLDANRYGLFGHDSWDAEYEEHEVIDAEAQYDDDGNETAPQQTHVERTLVREAGDEYIIRYEEALALECAYQRWRLEQLEERINQIASSNS